MTIPSSLTDIVNLSLTSIGEAPIANINTSNNTTAQVIRRWIDVIIQEVQQEIQWNELYTGPVTLTVHAEDFAGVAGQFQYLLPADFIQIYEVGVDVNDVPQTQSVDARQFNNPWWRLEDNFLIARVDQIQILYGRIDTNVSVWSIQLREVIYTSLAEKLAYEITDNIPLQKLWTEKLKLAKAKAFSSRQNKGRSFRTRPQFFGMATARRSDFYGNRSNLRG